MFQAAQELLLFQRIQPDQDHHAIAEQYSDTIRIDAKRKRCRGKDIAALEARHIEALADEEGARRDTGPDQRRRGSLAHGSPNCRNHDVPRNWPAAALSGHRTPTVKTTCNLSRSRVHHTPVTR